MPMITPVEGWDGKRHVRYAYEVPKRRRKLLIFLFSLATLIGYVNLTDERGHSTARETPARGDRSMALARHNSATSETVSESSIAESQTPALGRRFHLESEHVSCVARARRVGGLSALITLACNTDPGEKVGFFPVARLAAGEDMPIFGAKAGEELVVLVPPTALSFTCLQCIDNEGSHIESFLQERTPPGKYELRIGPKDEAVKIAFVLPPGREEDVVREFTRSVEASMPGPYSFY